MRLFDILKKPIITEKTSVMELSGTYVLEVSKDATKIDIAKAIFEIYWLEVSNVRVVNTREKFKQTKKWMAFKRRPSRKAYVTLKDVNAKLDFSIIK